MGNCYKGGEVSASCGRDIWRTVQSQIEASRVERRTSVTLLLLVLALPWVTTAYIVISDLSLNVWEESNIRASIRRVGMTFERWGWNCSGHCGNGHCDSAMPEDDACSAGLCRVMIGPDCWTLDLCSSTGGRPKIATNKTRLLPSCIDKH
jgi:hypothetical protein